MAQVLHDAEAIQVGHVQVEQEEIDLDGGGQGQALAGIGGAVQARVALPLEQALQQTQVGRLVIDDQNVRVTEGPGVHRLLRPFRQRLVQQYEKFVHVEGFGQVGAGAGSQQALALAGRGIGGQDHHRQGAGIGMGL